MIDPVFVPVSEFQRLTQPGLPPAERLGALSDLCRINALSAIKRAGSGHIGGSFSAIDLYVYLYFRELNTLVLGLRHPDRDVLISSKGHDGPAQYAALVAAGVIPLAQLQRLRRLGGLPGHPEVGTPGIEANCGSLGMGISKGRGIAFAKRLAGRGGRVLVLTGDGELQEGQNWEALQGAAHHGLTNLWVIVDANGIQTDRPTRLIRGLGAPADLAARVAACGWRVERCDGHDFAQIEAACGRLAACTDQPKLLLAETVKGKGVGFMHGGAGDVEPYRWHAGAPDDSAYERAVDELLARVTRRLAAHGVPPPRLERAARAMGAPYPASGERIARAYGAALADLAAERADLVVLDADLASDCGLESFAQAYPERFIENGIAEQDMVSMAGGLALAGYLPLVHSFSSFLAARACEQIHNNATENTRVIYVCNYAGLLPAGAGRSHQGVRDIALLGSLPNVVVVEPCNAAETRALLSWCVFEATASCALRLSLQPSPEALELPEDYRVEFGRGVVLRAGRDAVLFGYGPVMLHEALAAARLLEREEIGLRVVNLPWLNRVDRVWFEGVIADCAAIVTLDNHQAVGGLGDLLLNQALACDALRHREFVKLALEDFPVCGTPAEVLRCHRLDADGIATRVRTALRRERASL